MQSESSTGPPAGAVHDGCAEASTQPGTRDSALAALAGQAAAAAGPDRVLTRSTDSLALTTALCSAALRHCLGGSDGRAQTQGVSESAAVAAGRERLASRNVLPVYHSCDTDSVQESKRF